MKKFFSATGLAILCITGFSFIDTKNTAPAVIIYTDTQYVCLPCGSSCDNAVYDKPGICSHCNMKLVDKATVKFKTVEPEAVCSFIDGKGKKNVVLLDVRTPEEFNGKAKDKFGKLAGAINIPVQELEKRVAELSKYKNKQILVYCSHSHRSPQASYMLMQNGFTKVTNMQLGISEWKNKVQANKCNNNLYIAQ
jgi:rhodanese-related sulfurtransferase/DNA-directed RNA polymerase subunit RPC12/RpoP